MDTTARTQLKKLVLPLVLIQMEFKKPNIHAAFKAFLELLRALKNTFSALRQGRIGEEFSIDAPPS